ncbi:MAG: hypothetical protein KC415_01155 [Anaerolineales bacterium]|nr:hypothetical protein [Anaerolineales bacterium]MCB9004366.1 hypothetical protein [Ardenticatenaceae bacterium]
MFQRIAKSWELVKASWNVLLADKELLIFPVISAIASIIVMATFAIPVFMAGVFDTAVAGQSSVLSFLVGLLLYIVLYFVTFYFNSALVGAAMIRLEGGDPTVSDGLQIANKHLGSILGYAAIAATVGMILRAISERSGLLGRIVVSLIGFAWNVATFLAVPVLVIEDVSPIDAIKRSANLLKRTWGEQIVGNFSIGTIFGLIGFFVIIGGVASIIAAAAIQSTALIITAVAIMVLALVALGLVSSALTGIYTAAVYRYATAGEIGAYFDPDVIKNTFKQK